MKVSQIFRLYFTLPKFTFNFFLLNDIIMLRCLEIIMIWLKFFVTRKMIQFQNENTHKQKMKYANNISINMLNAVEFRVSLAWISCDGGVAMSCFWTLVLPCSITVECNGYFDPDSLITREAMDQRWMHKTALSQLSTINYQFQFYWHWTFQTKWWKLTFLSALFAKERLVMQSQRDHTSIALQRLRSFCWVKWNERLLKKKSPLNCKKSYLILSSCLLHKQ